MWLQITPLDHPYKRSRNNPAQQSIWELWLCYTGGTRLDSPSSIIMKQPLPGAALTVCKEISVHRWHSHFLSTRNWFSHLLSSCRITNYNVATAIRVECKPPTLPYLMKTKEENCVSCSDKIQQLGNFTTWFTFFFRLYNYCKIDFSFSVYWLFLSTFFQSKVI